MSKTKGEQAVNRSVLDKAQRHSIAQAIVNATDKAGQATTFRETILNVIGKVKGLSGKPMPETEVDLIADDCATQYTDRGLSDDSVKALKSAAKKLARCSPVVAGMERDFPSIDGLKKYCTILQKMEFDVAATDKLYDRKAKPNLKKSAEIHLRAVLGMTGKDHFCSADAKAALAFWCERAGLKIGEKADLVEDDKRARAFLK
jgi:hypothetical protein